MSSAVETLKWAEANMEMARAVAAFHWQHIKDKYALDDADNVYPDGRIERAEKTDG